MKIIRRIFIILLLLSILLLLTMMLYLNYGYQLYFNLGFIKLGNSNNNIIFIIIGLILFIIGTYYLFKQIIKRRGIIITIVLYFVIFLIPFLFLIVSGMNENYSFTYKTSANKKLLIMGYGNKKEKNMKYMIYENLFWGFYEKIGEIDYVDYRLSTNNIIEYNDVIEDEKLYYSDDKKNITLMYFNSNNELITKELIYKH